MSARTSPQTHHLPFPLRAVPTVEQAQVLGFVGVLDDPHAVEVDDLEALHEAAGAAGLAGGEELALARNPPGELT